MPTLHHTHPWNVAPAQAVAIQRMLAAQVVETPLRAPVRTIAGADMSVKGTQVRAAVVLFSMDDLHVVDQAVWQGSVEFPYVPGLLSFREAPALLRVLDLLGDLPDLLITDSHGRAHPRRLGLASHLGVLLDRPVFGVAKSRLIGTHAAVPNVRGASVPLCDDGETVGMVVRTRAGVKPVFVSVGHRIALSEAVAITLQVTTRYRLPEPTRQAHLLSRRPDA